MTRTFALGRALAPLALLLLSSLACAEEEVASFEVGQVRPTGLVCHVAISPDGKQVAAFVRGTSHEKEERETIRVWDLKTKKEVARIPAEWERGPGRLFTYTPDGKQLVCTSTKAVFVYDLAKRKLARTFTTKAAGPSRAALSGDGKTLVCGDARVGVYELATGKELTAMEAPHRVYSIAVSHDGKRVAAGHYGAKITRKITIWDAPSRTILHNLKIEGGAPEAMAFSADAKRLVAVCSSGHGIGPAAWLYDLAKGNIVASLDIEKRKMGNAFSPVGVTFTPKGDKVVMVANNGKGSGIYVWEPVTGKLHGRTGMAKKGEDETPYHVSEVNGMGVSADRRTVVTGHTKVRVLDVSKEVGASKKP
jgi:WD40 repeat protein